MWSEGLEQLIIELDNEPEENEKDKEPDYVVGDIFENYKACLGTAIFSTVSGAIAFNNSAFTLYQAVGVVFCLIVGIVYGKKENLF